MDRKTDHDKLKIQGLEWNLVQLCMWLARLFFAAGGEPSSKHYFTDKPSGGSRGGSMEPLF